jgi:hypothetical protein
MKLITVVIFIVFSQSVFSSTVDEKIAKLQNRVLELEKKFLSLRYNGKKTGLKVKDMKNKKVNSRSLSSYAKESSSGSFSKKQQKDIMNQINAFKNKREENQRLLDEIMKSDQ